MLFSVEQVFVGRDERRAPLETPMWKARLNDDSKWLAFIYCQVCHFEQGHPTTVSS